MRELTSTRTARAYALEVVKSVIQHVPDREIHMRVGQVVQRALDEIGVFV